MNIIKVIESNTPPSSSNSIWLHNGTLKCFDSDSQDWIPATKELIVEFSNSVEYLTMWIQQLSERVDALERVPAK